MLEHCIGLNQIHLIEVSSLTCLQMAQYNGLTDKLKFLPSTLKDKNYVWSRFNYAYEPIGSNLSWAYCSIRSHLGWGYGSV